VVTIGENTWEDNAFCLYEIEHAIILVYHPIIFINLSSYLMMEEVSI